MKFEKMDETRPQVKPNQKKPNKTLFKNDIHQ